jgi:hypothetical protein
MSDTATILALAAQQLQDASGVTWNHTTALVPYIDLALIEIVTLKPEAYPVSEIITLVPGSLQSLDVDAIELLDVVCNMGVSGTTPGKAIRSLTRESVDILLPDWQTFPPGTVVLYYMLDSRNPKNFYVIPPMASQSPMPQIKILQSEIPVLSGNPNFPDLMTFPLDTSYIPATVDYIVYRALAESTTIPGAMEKSQAYLKKFYQDLGIKTAVQKEVEAKEKGYAVNS